MAQFLNRIIKTSQWFSIFPCSCSDDPGDMFYKNHLCQPRSLRDYCDAFPAKPFPTPKLLEDFTSVCPYAGEYRALQGILPDGEGEWTKP